MFYSLDVAFRVLLQCFLLFCQVFVAKRVWLGWHKHKPSLTHNPCRCERILGFSFHRQTLSTMLKWFGLRAFHAFFQLPYTVGAHPNTCDASLVECPCQCHFGHCLAPVGRLLVQFGRLCQKIWCEFVLCQALVFWPFSSVLVCCRDMSM